MSYQPELELLTKTFQNCHIQVRTVDPKAPLDSRIDLGFSIVMRLENASIFQKYADVIQPKTIYRITDCFSCRYLFFVLPEREPEQLLLIGPFLTRQLHQDEFLEKTEQIGLSPKKLRILERYYADIPYLPAGSHLYSLLDAFCNRLWPGEEIAVEEVERNKDGNFSALISLRDSEDPSKLVQNMGMIEMRYQYENELISAVEKGQLYKAERLISSFSTLPFERRLADPLRNLKNYCIISNTLLRKAAERGGVHPLYLDSASADFAKKIEQLPAIEQAPALLNEMFCSYCRLVKRHAMKPYSPPVQKTIACIETDLSADLKLHTLAKLQNLSSAYLSDLFKRETGQTLTAFVNQKRIQQAMQLLRSTHLQIQTIAQHCGMPDVQYFSKLFKKMTGKTPREFREQG